MNSSDSSELMIVHFEVMGTVFDELFDLKATTAFYRPRFFHCACTALSYLVRDSFILPSNKYLNRGVFRILKLWVLSVIKIFI